MTEEEEAGAHDPPSESEGFGMPPVRGKRRPSLRGSASHLRSPPASQAVDKENGGGAAANCRYDSSLGLLTKKFVTLVEEAPDGILDLNNAATSLQVQKRRIYDITNVLEGIGLIEKKGKNNIQWRGSAPAASDELHTEFTTLQKDVAALNEDSLLLEKHIRTLQDSVQQMTDHPANRARLYVTNEDIIKLKFIGEDVVFAVTAPHGTTLVVPDPDELVEQGGPRRYRAILTSKTEPMGVWLCSSTHQDQAPDGGSPSNLANNVQGDNLDGTKVEMKMEDTNQGLLGPVGGLMQEMHGLNRPQSIGHADLHSSPNSFLRLQTPEMEPDCWFGQDKTIPSVGDIFADLQRM